MTNSWTSSASVLGGSSFANQMEINAQTSRTFHGIDPLCVQDPIQFSKTAAQNLLRNRRVVIMGCSVQRDLYKDIVLLLQEERYLSKYENRVKGSRTVVNDTLLKGGILEELKNDPSYREVREYRKEEFHIRFYFITRAYNPIVLGFIRNIYAEFDPDIIMFNSTIWDVNRNGPPFDHLAYEQNVRYVCQVLILMFSKNCKLIWLHQPPVTPKCATGRIVLAANHEVLKSNVLRWMYEAVCIGERITKQYGFKTVDLHHMMKHRTHWIAKDGVHWASEGYRCMSLLIFHKLSEMLHIQLPAESVQYSYPTEISAEELNKVFDEDDNDIRYLYASKVDSLIDFDGSNEGSDEAKPLPQLLDHENFKKVVERNKLMDTVVTNEKIDGSFRTADDIKAHHEREEYRKMTAPNPMQERLKNFFSSNLANHTRVTVSPKNRLNAYFQKPVTTGGTETVSEDVKMGGVNKLLERGGVSFVPAGALTGKESAIKEEAKEPAASDRPSFFQSPEEVAERYKQQFVTSTNFESSQNTSGGKTEADLEKGSLKRKLEAQNMEGMGSQIKVENSGPDVIEASDKKIVKVNRLAQMFK